MATVKRIVSDEVYQSENRSVDDIAKEAIFIQVDPHGPTNSEEMKWNLVGRPIFGDAIDSLRHNLPKIQHDTEKDSTN